MAQIEQEGDYEELFDNTLDAFQTYEEYLDSHITEEDKYYLQDIELARQLKEQGHHSKTEIMSREDFYKKKSSIEEARLNQNKDKHRTLAHLDIIKNDKLKSCPFLLALAEREVYNFYHKEQVLNGKLLTIIFIRVETKQNEISGYIDYAHRLKTEDFRLYFESKKKLLPKPSDLSYFNWRTNACCANDSPNFKVDASNGNQGLIFRNKRDRKQINVDPNKKLEENMQRTEIQSSDYTQIVLYDHYTRRK